MKIFLHLLLSACFFGIIVSQQTTDGDMDLTSDYDLPEMEDAGEVEAADMESADMESADMESADVSEPDMESADNAPDMESADSAPDMESADSSPDMESASDVEESSGPEELNSHGISINKMKSFCSGLVEGSEPADTHTCTYLTCKKNGYIKNAHVFNDNICPSGQFCVSGKCESTKPPAKSEALTEEEFEVVNAQCKKDLGTQYQPYCSDLNIMTQPSIAKGCKNDLCEGMLCAGWEKSRWRFTWAYLNEGDSCGNGKTCKDSHCQ